MPRRKREKPVAVAPTFDVANWEYVDADHECVFTILPPEGEPILGGARYIIPDPIICPGKDGNHNLRAVRVSGL